MPQLEPDEGQAEGDSANSTDVDAADTNSTKAEAFEPRAIIYVPDKWTEANFTIMLESGSFHEIEDFVRKRQHVKTQLAIEYTFNCKDVEKPWIAAMIFATVYFVVFVIVCTYTIVKY